MSSPGNLLILPGHGIFQDGGWHGHYRGEEAALETQLGLALQLLSGPDWEALMLSGGYTRPNLLPPLRNSEAGGMMEFIRQNHPDTPPKPILLENFARDSFENLFFSLLNFYAAYRRWPQRIGVISWPFKALRYYAICVGLKIPPGRFVFFGQGDAADPAAALAGSLRTGRHLMSGSLNELYDPLHRDQTNFARKRRKRMPLSYAGSEQNYLAALRECFREKAASPEVFGLIDQILTQVSKLSPGPQWRELTWPWQESKEE